MTFEEIDARYRAAVMTGVSEEWDDPETASDETDDELGHRDADEEPTFDERGEQEGDSA